LEYIRSITSDLFGNGQLNDVVEGRNGNELLVTQWLQEPVPMSGPTRPTVLKGNSVMESIGSSVPTGGKIFRCVWDENVTSTAPAECSIAFAGGQCPNGITKKTMMPQVWNKGTESITEVFVSDPFIGKLYKFKISNGRNSAQPDGQLLMTDSINTPYGCDNLVYDAEADFINCGANLDIPAALSLFSHEHQKRLGNTIPGTNMKIVPPGGDQNSWLFYPHHAMHDGTQQKMCSTAISYGSVTLFGAPPSTKGILVCDAKSGIHVPGKEDL